MMHVIQLWLSAYAIPMWAFWAMVVAVPSLLVALAIRPIKAYRAKRRKRQLRAFQDRFAGLIGDYRQAVNMDMITLILEDQRKLVAEVTKSCSIDERETMRPVLRQLDHEMENASRRINRVPGQSLAPHLPVPASIAPVPVDPFAPLFAPSAQVASTNPEMLDGIHQQCLEEIEYYGHKLGDEAALDLADDGLRRLRDRRELANAPRNDVYALIESAKDTVDDPCTQLEDPFAPWVNDSELQRDPADLTPVDPYMAHAVADTVVIPRSSVVPEPAEDTLRASRADMMLPPPPAHQNDLELWDEKKDDEKTGVFHLDTLRLIQDDDLVPGQEPISEDPVFFPNPLTKASLHPPTSEEVELAAELDDLEAGVTTRPSRIDENEDDDGDTVRPAPVDADENVTTMRPAASDGISYADITLTD